MKKNNSKKTLAIILLIAGCLTLQAEPVFQASFEESSYKAGSPLPLGFGKIQFGKWYFDRQDGFPILVTEEKAISVPCSLVLENTGATLEPGKLANAWGTFGVDETKETEVANALAVSCGFLITRIDGTESQSSRVSVSAKSGSMVISALLGVNGKVVIPQKDAPEIPVGPIEANKWYFLEMLLPNAQQGVSNATINLYEADGAARGKQIATIQGPQIKAGTAYTGIVFSNNLPNSKVFFDEILAAVKN